MRIVPYGFLLLFLIALTASCSRNAPEETALTPEPLNLEETMRIESGDGSDDSEPLLGRISFVATGPDGDIYLYDAANGRIFVYAEDGTYLRAFGRSGQGPGELGSVYRLFVDSRNRVIVSDGENARFTLFESDGTLIKSEPLQNIRSIRDMEELPDGRIVVTGWHSENEGIIHIFNSDLSQIETSLGSIDAWVQTDDERILHNYRSSAGRLQVIDERSIAFVPTFYRGELMVYRWQEDGSWSHTRLQGYRSLEEPLAITSESNVSPSEAVGDIPQSSILSISIMEGNIEFVHTRTSSRGLFADGNGGLLHLHQHFGEESNRVIVERFDPNAGLRSYGTILEGRVEDWHVEDMTPDGGLFLSNQDSLQLRLMQIRGWQ